MPIYTKTGDKGETSLFGGKRVSKADPLVQAYGSVDELNSWIGLLISKLENEEKKELLTKIQADLHMMAGVLAGWHTELASLETRVTEMEVEIDAMEGELQPLTNFILPGGTELASQVHIVRTITRRIERELVGLKHKEKDPLIKYVNRLSDLFFVLARFINKSNGVPDVVWIGIPRKK